MVSTVMYFDESKYIGGKKESHLMTKSNFFLFFSFFFYFLFFLNRTKTFINNLKLSLKANTTVQKLQITLVGPR